MNLGVIIGYFYGKGLILCPNNKLRYFDVSEEDKLKKRKKIHIAFAAVYLLVIIAFRPFHTQSLIDKVFEIAGYTYGPLLGLYTFGLFIKNRRPADQVVSYIAIASPILSYILNIYSKDLFNGYQFGFEILIINGLITFLALLACSKKITTNTERI